MLFHMGTVPALYLHFLAFAIVGFLITGCGSGLCLDSCNTLTLTSLTSPTSLRWSVSGFSSAKRYKVYTSSSDNIGTAALAVANGTPYGNDYARFTDYFEIHGIEAGRPYYISVLELTPQTGTVRLVGTAFVPEKVESALRGYSERACGLDTDRDGVLGEPEDCQVCSGTSDASASAATSVYVLSPGGSNSGTCGTPSSPCLTLQYAIDNRTSGKNTVCFSGTFNESVVIKNSGTAAFYTRNAFRYPSAPFAFIGWDRDGDRKYPPTDLDDTAVIDGHETLNYAFNNSSASHSYIELAHFTVKRFRTTSVGVKGGLWKADGISVTPYLNFHDLLLDSNTEDEVGGDYGSIITQDNPGGGIQYLAFENNSLNREGQILWIRDNSTNNNLLFKNITANLSLIGAQNIETFITHDASDITIEGNVLNVDRTQDISLRTYAMAFGDCTQNVFVRNNSFTNFSSGFAAGVFWNRPCDVTRRITNLNFERNFVTVSFGASARGFHAFDTTDVTYGTLAYAIQNVSVLNNIIVGVGSAMPSCIEFGVSNTTAPHTGLATVVGNTCVNAALQGFYVWKSNPSNGLDNIVFRNNIVDGPAGARYVLTEYVPASFSATANVYSGAGSTFNWNSGGAIGFAAWQAASAQDVGSTMSCDVAFSNPASSDYHLASSDSCASSVAVNNAPYTAVDYDSQTRQSGADFAGADFRIP